MRSLITLAKKLAAPAKKIRHINTALFGIVFLLSGIAIGHTSVPRFVQEVLAAALDGFGTVGRVAAFSNSSTLGDSQIFDSGTNVGIGTVGPAEKLHVAGGSIMTEGTGGTGRVVIKGTGVGGHQYEWYPDSPAVGDLQLYDRTSGGSPIVFKSSGNVGIGVTNPGSKLTVAGNIDNRGAVMYSNRYFDDDTNYYIDANTGSQVSTIYANNWFRAQGQSGLYFEDYGGGWHMTDPTWIRSYGSKPVYMNNGYDSGTPSGAGCGGGLGGGYTFQVCGSATVKDGLTVGNAGGAYTYITLRDDESPSGVKYIHANANLVGFLNSAGNWVSYWDNGGNMQNIGTIHAAGDICTDAGGGKCLSSSGGVPNLQQVTDQGNTTTKKIQAQRYEDDDANFYVDANTVSILNDIRPSIIYDRDNTGYFLDPNNGSQVNTIYANNWFRAQGQGGIYFQDYGGGWHMTDTTWLRAYGDKGVYTLSQIRADGGFCIGGSCRSKWAPSITYHDRSNQAGVHPLGTHDACMLTAHSGPGGGGSNVIPSNIGLSVPRSWDLLCEGSPYPGYCTAICMDW